MTLGEIKNLKMWDNIKFEGKDYYVVSTYGAQGNAYGIVIEDGVSGNQKYLKEKDFRGVTKNAANSCASSNPVVQNALKACNAKFKLGDVVTDEYGDKAVVLNPDAGNGSVKIKYVKDQKLVIVAPEEIKKAHNSTAANAEVVKNADTEASIDAEAKKLAREVLALASKYDALQKRLNKIGVYYTDYQAAANDLRQVHSVLG